MPNTDPIRERRINALRAEVSHRLEEINRLQGIAEANAIRDALEKFPSVPLREEADFGSDIYG
jgi:hypothetical protein